MKPRFEENYAENHSLEYFEQSFGHQPLQFVSGILRYIPYFRCDVFFKGKKIEAAKSLFYLRSNPIHEVGAMVGIDNTNHLIHLFQKAHWCGALSSTRQKSRAVYT